MSDVIVIDEPTVIEITNATVIQQGGGGGAVSSVNGQTGVVVLDTDNVPEGENKYITISELNKLAGIESGAQVNTVNSVAGKTGNVTLNSGDVGLGNVNNTSDADKPISSATQTALNNKQNTLVSGVNIKTINGQSLLGSGNIEIAGGGLSLTVPVFYSGMHFDQVLTNDASRGNNANAQAQNTLNLYPMTVHVDLTIDRIGLRQSTSQGAVGKMLIYSSGLDGMPEELLYESAELTFNAANQYVAAVVDFTFQTGVQYWIGQKIGGANFAGLILSATKIGFGFSGGNGTQIYSFLSRSHTYTDAAPDPFNFTTADLSTGNTASTRMRTE